MLGKQERLQRILLEFEPHLDSSAGDRFASLGCYQYHTDIGSGAGKARAGVEDERIHPEFFAKRCTSCEIQGNGGWYFLLLTGACFSARVIEDPSASWFGSRAFFAFGLLFGTLTSSCFPSSLLGISWVRRP